MDIYKLIDKLEKEKTLDLKEYEYIISEFTKEHLNYLREKAYKVKLENYGNSIYIRGLIEISNFCKNDCLYCGIRKSNLCAERYRLTKEEILECCETGYPLGFRTFVLQGGEDMYFTDKVLGDIVASIKEKYSDCAVTLSVGERSKESYKYLYDCGADRFLLRHETADNEHYQKLHPENLTLKNRIECLYNLKEIGYQVGCGFMVDSPYQTNECIAKDLKFIEEFNPDMVGIGPFIPHEKTPFKDFKSGNLDKVLLLLGLVRLINPTVLLPSTTALATLNENGRIEGLKIGANVVMPNLSPGDAKEKYTLYNNKARFGKESALNIENLKKELEKYNMKVECNKGDRKKCIIQNHQKQKNL